MNSSCHLHVVEGSVATLLDKKLFTALFRHEQLFRAFETREIGLQSESTRIVTTMIIRISWSFHEKSVKKALERGGAEGGIRTHEPLRDSRLRAG